MPQLVADDQVKLGPALQVSVELDVLLRRQKFLGQSNGPNEPDPAARLDGGHAQCRRDVRLAGAAGPQADDVLLGGCQGRNEMSRPERPPFRTPGRWSPLVFFEAASLEALT